MANTPPRIPRTIEDMVRALQRHVRLLSEFSDRAFAPTLDQDYLGEVAAKLRLLTSSRGTNKPLLLRLMDTFGVPSDSLRAHLEWTPLFTSTVSQPDVRRTHAQIVETWAAQHGAAHEDWEISEEFSGSFSSDQPKSYPVLAILLHETTREVLQAAEQVLARATPAAIAAAEAKRTGGRT